MTYPDIDTIRAQQGWDDSSMLDHALTYIANQQDDEAFVDFLLAQAQFENVSEDTLPVASSSSPDSNPFVMPLGTSSTPDPFIILEGGLVQNDPDLPVLNLDVLEDSFVDEDAWEDVITLHGLAVEHNVNWIVDKCEDWMRSHVDTKPDSMNLDRFGL